MRDTQRDTQRDTLRDTLFSDLAQNLFRWCLGAVNLFVFRKIVTSFFQIGKKSDLVLKFENFRSKTRARRDLFFHEVWILDQKQEREEALFFHELYKNKRKIIDDVLKDFYKKENTDNTSYIDQIKKTKHRQKNKGRNGEFNNKTKYISKKYVRIAIKTQKCLHFGTGTPLRE